SRDRTRNTPEKKWDCGLTIRGGEWGRTRRTKPCRGPRWPLLAGRMKSKTE
ncbi:hypothetical protein KI387_040021, partial [Taxus chinensis]